MKHDEYITVESEMGSGTTFHIYLPASQGHASKKTPTREVAITGKGRILLMDDEEMVRAASGEMLGRIG
jgi:hypothetical protein